MRRPITASYESKFWDLHDRDYETGIALEDIIDEEGLSPMFFPDDGEPTADEDDYKTVLDIYQGGGKSSMNVDDVVDSVTNYLQYSLPGVKSVYYEDSIDSIRFTIPGNGEYQFVVQRVR